MREGVPTWREESLATVARRAADVEGCATWCDDLAATLRMALLPSVRRLILLDTDVVVVPKKPPRWNSKSSPTVQ